MAGVNPLIAQGALNRVLTSIVVPSYPQLSAIAPNMSKSLVQLTFDGPFNDQIGTATGIVNSPLPYVMGQLVVSLLRSQLVSGLWIAQAQTQSILGTVTAYPDSPVFPAVSLTNCSITDIDPGAYDGQDPTVKITLKGVFYTNATLWSGAAALA
jgi:hypothetical protein